MTGLEVLKGARKLIEKRESWTKHVAKAKRHGKVCYCAHGAIIEASRVGGEHDSARIEADKFFEEAIPTKFKSHYVTAKNITMFNDNYETRHEDVLDVFDKAISKGARKD